MLYYNGRVRIVDANGDAVSNAKLNFYLTTTVTPAPVYTDAALTVAHTQPIRSAANGFVAPIYLDPSVTYKSVITDGNDVALPDGTVDPVIQSPFSAAALGAILYPRTLVESAALVTPVNYAKWPSPWKDMSRFVSDNTGAIDVTAGLVAGLAAEKNVILPEGSYKYSSNLTIPASCTLTGVQGKSILLPTVAVTKALIQLQGSTVSGLVINGSSATSAKGLCIGDEGVICNNGFTYRTQVINFAGGVGIKYNYGVVWTFEDCFAELNYHGYEIGGAGGLAYTPTVSTYTRCVAKNNLHRGVNVLGGSSITWSGGDCEINQEAGMHFDQGGANTIDEFYVCGGSWFENNWQSLALGAARHAQYDILGISANGVRFQDIYFAKSANYPRSINLAGVTDYLLDNVHLLNQPGQVLSTAPSTGIVVNWPLLNGSFPSVFTDTAGTAKIYQQQGLTTVSIGGSSVTLSANAGTDRLSIANNAVGTRTYSQAGILIARDNATGCSGAFLIAAGQAILLAAAANGGATFTAVPGTANDVNVSVTGGTVVNFQNKTGVTAAIESSFWSLS